MCVDVKVSYVLSILSRGLHNGSIIPGSVEIAKRSSNEMVNGPDFDRTSLVINKFYGHSPCLLSDIFKDVEWLGIKVTGSI